MLNLGGNPLDLGVGCIEVLWPPVGGHCLFDVHRLIEEEALTINMAITANRRSYTQLACCMNECAILPHLCAVLQNLLY